MFVDSSREGNFFVDFGSDGCVQEDLGELFTLVKFEPQKSNPVSINVTQETRREEER